jgi:hypothetical protein
MRKPSVHRFAGVWLAILVGVAACVAPQADVGQTEWDCPFEREGSPAGVFVAAEPGGGLVAFESERGTVLGRSTSGDGAVVDLELDPWRLVLVAVVAPSSDRAQIVEHPLSSPGRLRGAAAEPVRFEPARSRAVVDAGARVVATRRGPLVFGSTWRLLATAPQPPQTMSAPPPLSAWVGDERGSPRAHALVRRGAGELALVSAAIDDELGPLEEEGVVTAAMAARMAPAADGPGVVVAAVRAGALVVGFETPRGRLEHVTGPALGVAQLLHLGRTHDGGERIAVLSTRPSRLTVADLHPDGARHVALEVSENGCEPASLCRALAAVSRDEVLVAGDAGVVAVRIWEESGELRAGLDDDFDGSGLQGPLVGPLPIDPRSWSD